MFESENEREDWGGGNFPSVPIPITATQLTNVFLFVCFCFSFIVRQRNHQPRQLVTIYINFILDKKLFKEPKFRVQIIFPIVLVIIDVSLPHHTSYQGLQIFSFHFF